MGEPDDDRCDRFCPNGHEMFSEDHPKIGLSRFDCVTCGFTRLVKIPKSQNEQRRERVAAKK